MIQPDVHIEAGLINEPLEFQDGDDILFQDGSAVTLNGIYWAEISVDLSDKELRISRGIRDADPAVRVAPTGTCSFFMDNGLTNSGGVYGFYTPGHANVRGGWGIDTKIRVGFSSALYNSGETDWRFYGWVSRIAPVAGKFGKHDVEVKAVDYIEVLNDFERMKLVTALTDATEDEAYTAVVAAISKQPEGTEFSVGVDTMPYVFHRSAERGGSAYEEIDRVAKSTFSYVYVDKRGYLVSKNRLDRVKNTTIAFSVADSDPYFTGISFDDDRERGMDRIETVTYPVEIGSDIETAFELENPVKINPGETYTLIAEYKDPISSRPVGLTDPVTMVAGTHYRFGSAPDGTSQGLNDKLGVTPTFYSAAAEVVYTNNGSRVGYLNTTLIEGYLMRFDDPVESVLIVDSDGNRTTRLDLPYQDNEVFALDVRNMVKNVYATGERVNSMKLMLNDETAFGYAMGADIGSRVSVTETMTGLNGYEGFINGEDLTYKPGKMMEVTYILAPAATDERGLWGVSKWGQSSWAFAEG